jgi:3-oxoacyl-[acyl-carrier-protein] synthase-3
MNWNDIDLILDCSTSIHRLIPCNASHIQSRFAPDAYGIPGFDIQSTCLGFIVGMNVANALIGSGQYRNILLTCSERPLSAANWNEPESAALLGDAAAAVILKPRENSSSKIYYAHETWSEHLEVCRVNGGNPDLPPYTYTPELDSEYRFHMDGRAVFKAAYKLLPPMFNRLVVESGINRDELHLIPHQASPKANALVCRALKIREERFYGDITHHGNLVAASIPVVLHHCLQNKLIPKNSPVMLLGTSAGYSQAGLIFQL